MAQLSDLVMYLDQELKIREISDYPGAVNGLQLETHQEITRIIAAVDASLEVIREAAQGGPGLLLVHHGMFWQGAQPLRGANFEKIRIAMEAGLAIYSAHLPLDLHPTLGNNIVLAEALGVTDLQPFLPVKGQPIGLRGIWKGERNDLIMKLREVVSGSVHLAPGGKSRIETIGIVTGGAGSEVAAAAAAGVDIFVTGEGPHWSYVLAEELGINLALAGHYATEVFGVKRLAESISSRFALNWSFVDRPTGL